MESQCPYCQNPIPPSDESSSETVCQACGSSFHQQEDLAETAVVGTHKLGKFELLEKVGVGAFGAVWKARDSELGRIVAIKLLHPSVASSSSDRERFFREARSVAQLRHPGIVTVYEVTELDEGPAIVSAFVEGVTLRDLVHVRRLTFRETAELVGQVAEALDYAHSMKLIHRDVKPANVMIQFAQGASLSTSIDVSDHVSTASGVSASASASSSLSQSSSQPSRSSRPRAMLLDFGLALRDDAEITLTADGQVIGTPAYMSPEQAAGEGHRVDRRSDIYALGIVLYELLVGELPFRGSKVAVMHQVLHDEPRMPRRVNEKIPRDLESICLKAIAKSRSGRYPNAREMADDLRRWLNGEPVLARPVGAVEKFGRWCRRKPAAAGLMFVSCLAACLLFVGILWHNSRLGAALQLAEDRRIDSEQQRTEAVANLYQSLVREARALRLARLDGYRNQVWDRLREAQLLAYPQQNTAELRHEAVACMGDFAGQEPVTWAEFPSDAEIKSVALNPDATEVAAGLRDGTVLVRGLTDKLEIAELPGHKGEIIGLDFVLGGRELISADGNGVIMIWSPSARGKWQCSQTISTGSPIGSFAVTPDARHCVTYATEAQLISLWDLKTGTAINQFSGPNMEVFQHIAISHDGRLLAAAYSKVGGSGVLIWDIATKEVIQDLLPGIDYVIDVSISSDGQMLACAGTAGVAVFSLADFQRRLLVPGDYPRDAALSPGAGLLAIPATQFDVVRLWNVATNSEVATLRNLNSPHKVAFSLNGQALVASGPQSVRVWNLAGQAEKLEFAVPGGGVPATQFSPDGATLATASKDRKVRIWKSATGDLLRTLDEFASPVQTLAFSPDGRMLATGTDSDGHLQLWTTQTWSEVVSVDHKIGDSIWSTSFSPRGDYIAAGGSQGVMVWRLTSGAADASSGGPALELVARPYEGRGDFVCFTDDSRYLAWAESDKGYRPHVWDLREARELSLDLPQVAYTLQSLSFQPNSNRLVFVSANRDIEVWDVVAGTKTDSFHGAEVETGGILSALSPDGTCLAVGGGAQSVAIWDLTRRERLCMLPQERSTVWSFNWSPDGRQLAVGSSSGSVALWDVTEIRRQLEEIGLAW